MTRPFVVPEDPFKSDRRTSGVVEQELFGERFVALLRWRDVRQAARDYATFDSGHQGRVPTPEETGIRTFRQLPIETNPPEHTLWRHLVQPYFRRPMQDGPQTEMQAIVDAAVQVALSEEGFDVPSDFALPIQSKCLAVLLDCDREIAHEWMSWGMHAFRTNGQTDPVKAGRFLDFIDRMLAAGEEKDDQGLFTYLSTATCDGRRLTQDEKRGICHLALSGGRDTVVNSITGAVFIAAASPGMLQGLRDEPRLVDTAAEEMFRVLSPLPQIARVCPTGFRQGALEVPPNHRAGLCWSSANRDEDVFEDPEHVRLDRTPNPHVAFGAGAHTCLGAPMARLIMRRLLSSLGAQVDEIEIQHAAARENAFGTPFLFDHLRVAFRGGTLSGIDGAGARRP